MGYKGEPFTWTNKRTGQNLTRVRLDRVLCSSSWRAQFGEAVVFHEKMVESDHCPIRLELHYRGNRRKNTPFRIDERWLEKEECKELIARAWDPGGHSTDQLNKCQRELKEWAKEFHKNSMQREQDILSRLEILQQPPRTTENVEEEKILTTELTKLWRDEEAFWSQCSRVNWLQKGDQNTSFFHSSTIQRKHRNKILKLQDGEGNWIEDENSLKRLAEGFYKDLFKARNPIPFNHMLEGFPEKVTTEMNEDLCATVTNGEIRKAVFSLGARKAPGPDGFSGRFYRRYWDILGDTLCREVRGFFETANMPDGWNETHIAMIPKVDNPELISQYRPISCCNFRYKIISKIMATRLKRWTPELVSELQTAFTGGRLIQDNIIIVHEALHHFKNHKLGRRRDMMLKLDMKKAYDMVDWNCLEALLKKYGFDNKWCGWVSACIRTVSFSILFNGEATDSFKPSRGIRQGDPLSPFLFILMSNALTFLIDKAVESDKLKGIKLNSRCPVLTHCLFADDTVIFGKADFQEAQNIIDIIGEYGAITGQEVNINKSSVFFSANVPGDVKDHIIASIGFASSNCHSKYLGVPTEWGNSKKETFKFLIQRMEKMGEAWKSLLLSHGGKEILLKAVIQAIPSFIMFLFYLPKALTKKMDSLLSNFFWSGSMQKSSLHWCRKEILCMPKSEGGLGFRSFNDFNLALLAKQAWRLLTTPDSLWSRLLKGLYFPRGDFLNAKKGSRASWIWASLWEAKKVIGLGAVRVIGSGEDSWVDQDPWIPFLDGFTLRTGPQNHRKVNEWIDPGERKWKMDVISGHVSGSELEAILRIPIGEEGADDFWAWNFNEEGRFTVRSAYHKIHRANSIAQPSGNTDKWKWIWSLHLPPKLKFFVWRCSRNGLATKERLLQRKCAPNSSCQVCQNPVETINHCLFHCPHAKVAWNELFPSLPLPPQGTLFFDWFCSLKDVVQQSSLIHIIFLCWNIWKARNECSFKGRVPWTPNVCQLTYKELTEWNTCPRSPPPMPSLPTQLRGTQSHTSPPPSNQSLMIHCDGSFISDSQPAAYGVVVVNHHGQVCDGRAENLLCSTPIEAETKALLEGVKLAQEYGSECTVHSDCQVLVKAVDNDRSRWPWRCAAWISSIVSILRSNPLIKIKEVSRTLNVRADWVARSKARASLPDDWINILDLISDLL
ncbi:unnamed protein product [Linum trigynum]|uniref:Reverse transcriptase domain-containing protein n=1 Tax=Linum trigynum TaxID=586398 RepID=A0AAV2FGB0_9ROSI